MGKTEKAAAPEIVPDAWERFERAVNVVAKSPPQHRKAKPSRGGKSGAKKRRSQKKTPAK